MWREAKFIIVVGVVLAIAVAFALAWIALRSLDVGGMSRLIGERVTAASGREFAIRGPLTLRVLPSLAVVAGDVHIGNAQWGSRPEMLRLRRAEAVVALWPLLRGRLEVRRVVLIEPDLLLETDQSGTGNWVMPPRGGNAADGASGKSGVAIALERLHLENARIVYRDGKTGRETRLHVDHLSVEGEGNATRIEGALILRGQRVSVKGTTGRLEAAAAGPTAWPIDLVLATDGATAALRGTLGVGEPSTPLHVAVQAEVSGLAGLSRLAGTDLGLPLPLKLSATARGGGHRYVVDPFEATIAGQVARGRATVSLAGARPSVKASIVSPSLDVARLLPKTGGTSGPVTPPAHRRLFGDEPLPVDVPLEAHLDARVGRLTLPNALPLQAVHLVIAARDGHLEVSPLTFTLAGGALAGRVALEAAPGGAPRVRVTLEGAGVRLEELAAAIGRTGQVSGGETSVAVDLAGTGGSLRRLAATASGDVRIVVGPARLAATALDLGGDALTRVIDAVNPFHKSDPITELQCAVARLPVRDGVVTIERSVAYETSKVKVVVAGLVDLREETLDLAIRPSITRGLGIGVADLAELVRVTGHLTEPRIALDTLGAARHAVSMGAAVATGGLSLLGERLLTGMVDAHPCESALAPRTRGVLR